jgi:hypothetical protein
MENCKIQPKPCRLFLFERNSAHWAAVYHRLAITVSAFGRNDMRLPIFQFEDIRTNRLAGAASDAKLFIDFYFSHVFFLSLRLDTLSSRHENFIYFNWLLINHRGIALKLFQDLLLKFCQIVITKLDFQAAFVPIIIFG